ncbi:ribose-phosphate pyrophosphokinase, partial [Mytilus galloprovincialis]
MIDDVVSFVKIAEVLKERGAYKVVVTNTVPHEIQKMQCHKIKTVDISVMLSEAIPNAL